MVRANRYLHKRCGRGRSGERYYLRVPVPADLRSRFGRIIERPLRTSDPRVARIRRDALLPEIRAIFDRARQEPTLGQVTAAVRREELDFTAELDGNSLEHFEPTFTGRPHRVVLRFAGGMLHVTEEGFSGVHGFNVTFGGTYRQRGDG